MQIRQIQVHKHKNSYHSFYSISVLGLKVQEKHNPIVEKILSHKKKYRDKSVGFFCVCIFPSFFFIFFLLFFFFLQNHNSILK